MYTDDSKVCIPALCVTQHESVLYTTLNKTHIDECWSIIRFHTCLPLPFPVSFLSLQK